MTRIIQRCFLVLAFTGLLLSSAQETTVSEISDSTTQSDETSPSAPESSSQSVGTPSSYSSAEKVEDGKLSSTEAAAASSSSPEVSKNDVTQTSSEANLTKTTSEDRRVENSSVEFNETESVKTEGVTDAPSETSPLSSESHSGGLFKAELQDGNSNDTEKFPDESHFSNDNNTAGPESNEETHASDKVLDNTTNTYVVSETEESKDTTEAAATPSSGNNSSENTSNDSGPSSVPSKEELIYNSSYIDKNQSSDEMFSTPGKVQTEENETRDPKSATHKRSLNATNTATRATTESIHEDRSFSSPVTSHLAHAAISEMATEETSKDSPRVPIRIPEDVSLNAGYAIMEKEDTVSTEHDIIEAEVTSFPHTISSSTSDVGVSADHFVELGHVVPELASSDTVQDTHMPPISSAALSTTSEESIHPSESIDNTAQTSSARHDIATSSSNIHRFSDLEVENTDIESHPHSSAALVTFDPNGMTHNFSQDPDSVTFTPEDYGVGKGMPLNKYLSHLENSESYSQEPEHLSTSYVVEAQRSSTPEMESYTPERERELLLPNNGEFFSPNPEHLSSAYVTEVLGSSTQEKESPSSDREREMVSPSHGLLPHDEPVRKEMDSIQSDAVTHYSAINQFSTSGPSSGSTSETVKFFHPLNDESEEMLNDSPHFAQSKTAVTPTAEIKESVANKDLEMNVSNDISHVSSSGPQNTPETLNELDFSIHYQSEQSEIRPVTAASPIKASEIITTLPRSGKEESQSSSEATKSEQPGTLVETISPIIQPNPAPSVTQSAETTTVVLHPNSVPHTSKSDLQSEQENSTTTSTNSKIAGVAIKTSVSVSLPLSKSPNDSTSSTVDPGKDNVNTSLNVSQVILPLPIPINNDADGHPPPTMPSTEAPTPSTTASGGLRIRKPKLKFNSDDADEPATPRTRKPFLASLQRPSSTVGPPVSIFKKNRTRVASITSSTTARPFPKFSTIRVHYVSRLVPGLVPNGELVFSTEPITTTVPTTTETEEPFSDEPFTEQTQGPILPTEDDVTLVRVAGAITVDRGLRWNDQLNNRHSPMYKNRADFVQMQLDRLFRTSPIASQLWKVQIDGFSTKKQSRSVVIDFFLYLIKSPSGITSDMLTTVFHDKLINSTFSRFTVDTNKTTFDILNEEPLNPTTVGPEEEQEPAIPQWAIAVIVVGAASLIFIVLFAAVAILGRHHMRRRYSSKLNDEDSDRPSEWESKMAAAYENLAADTIYDAEDLHSDTYKKRHHNSTYHGRPTRPRRADSWSSSDWSPPPRRTRPQVHRIVV